MVNGVNNTKVATPMDCMILSRYGPSESLSTMTTSRIQRFQFRTSSINTASLQRYSCHRAITAWRGRCHVAMDSGYASQPVAAATDRRKHHKRDQEPPRQCADPRGERL